MCVAAPGSLPCKGRCRRRRRRGAAPCLGNTLPGCRTLPAAAYPLRNTGARPFRAAASSRPPPAPCVGADACIGPPSGLKTAAVYGSLPVFGRNVGRAISPAAGPCGTAVRCGARRCRTLRGISTANRQCTPQSAPSGASSSPCRGAFLCGCRPGSLPCKGRCRRRRRRGAAPDLANALPGRRTFPAAAYPAKHGGKPLPGRRTLPAAALIHFC